jgi:hypothetical protein
VFFSLAPKSTVVAKCSICFNIQEFYRFVLIIGVCRIALYAVWRFLTQISIVLFYMIDRKEHIYLIKFH